MRNDTRPLRRGAGPAAVLSLLFAAAAPLPAAAQTERYAAKTAERLAELGIDESEVRSIQYALKYNPQDRGPNIVGAKAWIRLTSCTGYLIVDMNRSAFVLQTYTEGDCRVAGVKAY